ncbi:MAG: DUF108 domain-containing protein [Candidatus Omnitrophica bacterium]|nr:DUF108 domain-containing protein [Candidatus Omnitrophota bacterium]
MKKTIGIVGCGTIGRALCSYANKDLTEKVGGILLWDRDEKALLSLSGDIPPAKPARSFEEVLNGSDLIVEAAGAEAVPDLLKAAISSGKDAMVMSVGGILGSESLLDEAESKGVRVLLPTGAIAGIDAVKAAKIAGIEEVSLTTRKPPASLKGCEYFREKGIDLEKITSETEVFRGSASEAMKYFPKNINVSALLSLAGIGADKTVVRIITSPSFTNNSHDIRVSGKAGRLSMLSENVPSPGNPRTSYMASLAAMASLKAYFSTVRIGT